MNLAEYNGTKEYRDHLARTLEAAGTRLSDGDFQMFAPGIRQEIARLDDEMAEYPLHLLLSCARHGWGGWAPVTIIQTASIAPPRCPSVTFSRPVAATPWTSMIRRFDDSRRIQGGPGALVAFI
jgi:hypothetical protein